MQVTQVTRVAFMRPLRNRAAVVTEGAWDGTGGALFFVGGVAARLGRAYLAPNGANFVDLHVYVGGAAMLDHPGSLYHYVYADQTPDFPLPFTYPPFAPVIFYPLNLLPFGLGAF